MVARVSGMQTQSLMRPLIVVALIFVAGCSSPGDSESTRSDQRAGRQNTEAVPVSTAVVAQKPVPLEVPAVGTAEAISSVQIRSQVTGQLGAIRFAEGQDVTQGQLLFELDPRPFQLALAQAEPCSRRTRPRMPTPKSALYRVTSVCRSRPHRS
jgi:membrane fusion protein, multidrug efflux system